MWVYLLCNVNHKQTRNCLQYKVESFLSDYELPIPSLSIRLVGLTLNQSVGKSETDLIFARSVAIVALWFTDRLGSDRCEDMILVGRSSVAVCLLLICCEFTHLNVEGAPATTSPDPKVSKLSRKKASRRVRVLPDPAEVLLIPDVSELDAEVR